MSTILERSSFSQQQSKLLASKLYIQPIVVGASRKYNTTKPGFNFYRIEDKKIILPYTIAYGITGVRPNIGNKYTQCKYSFTGKLRDLQEEECTKCWEYLNNYGSVIISLPPAFGKTVMGAYLASLTGLLTCVIVPVTPLLGQWYNTFTDKTDASVWIVGENNPANMNVIVCLSDRVKKIPEHIKKEVGVLILDEAHMLCTASQVNCFLDFQPLYIIVETATLQRPDGADVMLKYVSGSHGVYRDSVVPFVVHCIHTRITPDSNDWKDIVSELIHNEQRNNIILQYVLQYNDPSYKVCILTRRREHVEILYDMLISNGQSVDTYYDKKKSYNDSHVLIGTISKIGTGFDEASACPDFNGVPINILIIAISIKDEKLLYQNIGRSFRSVNPTILYLVDDNKIIRKHWNIGEKWFKSHNGTIKYA